MFGSAGGNAWDREIMLHPILIWLFINRTETPQVTTQLDSLPMVSAS